jgi:hypothetical protein
MPGSLMQPRPGPATAAPRGNPDSLGDETVPEQGPWLENTALPLASGSRPGAAAGSGADSDGLFCPIPVHHALIQRGLLSSAYAQASHSIPLGRPCRQVHTSVTSPMGRKFPVSASLAGSAVAPHRHDFTPPRLGLHRPRRVLLTATGSAYSNHGLPSPGGPPPGSIGTRKNKELPSGHEQPHDPRCPCGRR